jgi:hypothetical protein
MTTSNDKLALIAAVLAVAGLLFFGIGFAHQHSAKPSVAPTTSAPSPSAGGGKSTSPPPVLHATRTQRKAASRYFEQLRRIDVAAEQANTRSLHALAAISLHQESPGWDQAIPVIGSAAEALHTAGQNVQALTPPGQFAALSHHLAYIYFDSGDILDQYASYLEMHQADAYNQTFGSGSERVSHDRAFLAQNSRAFRADLTQISAYLGTKPPAWTAKVMHP